jgi:RNA polymerase sigma factor (sigma-70 family)
MPELPLRRDLRMRGLQLPYKKQMKKLPEEAGDEPRFPSPALATPLDRLLAQRGQFLAFLERRLHDPALAEDILQTSYLRAFEHQNPTISDETVTAWFYQILRNAIIDNFRRQTTRNKMLETWAQELEKSTEAGPELETEICGCLGDVVKELKPDYADILRAVDLGGQRLQDFAREHKLSASNAGVRVHRARAALRKGLLATCGACSEHQCLDCTCKKHAPFGS